MNDKVIGKGNGRDPANGGPPVSNKKRAILCFCYFGLMHFLKDTCLDPNPLNL